MVVYKNFSILASLTFKYFTLASDSDSETVTTFNSINSLIIFLAVGMETNLVRNFS